MPNNKHTTKRTNVLVIGCGGAGLRAAIEVKNAGLKVSVIGKRAKTDAHTVLAAGGINAALGNVDPKDSWEQHFADTYIEGYGLGDPNQIEIMAKEAPNLVKEIDKWGANFAKLENGNLDQRFFGAHSYRRTCYSGDFTGLSILKTLIDKSESLKIPIYDKQYVTELLISDEKCFGAMSFNTTTGERTVNLADAVILCTGGHTKIWKRSSSRKKENTGDGFYLGLKAGCQLRDMEMVQFHPSGMLFPEGVEGKLVTEAVRGEGGKLINNLGERFMLNYDKERMELSTRDKVAIANYTEISEGRGTINGGVYLDISHRNKEFIIEKIPTIYKQFLDFQGLDISKEPMEVAPTAHYSMGGIVVCPYEHSTLIKGLYAAGEVAGGLHGANRLGGNSLAEILIFGKKVGKASVNYSQKLKGQIRSEIIINNAHENINSFIKKGTIVANKLQYELSNVMWNYCGVIKDQKSLESCLNKVRNIKENIKKVNVSIYKNNCDELVQVMDLVSSIISAEATILSALKRRESRGSHQRSDFKNLSANEKCNYFTKLNKKTSEIEIFKKNIAPLREDLQSILNKTLSVDSLEGKLLE